jgi:hypothetical protein
MTAPKLFIADGGSWSELPAAEGAVRAPYGSPPWVAPQLCLVSADQGSGLAWFLGWSRLATPELALDAKTALTVTLSLSEGAIAGAETYALFRSTSDKVSPDPGDIVSDVAGMPRTDTVPTAATTYYYWLQARREAGRIYSGMGPRLSVTTNALPAVPQSFEGVGAGDFTLETFEATLTWSNAERADGKTIEVWNRNAGSWEVLEDDILPAETEFLHGFSLAEWDDYSNLANEINYRIKFNSQSGYATTTVEFSIS